MAGFSDVAAKVPVPDELTGEATAATMTAFEVTFGVITRDFVAESVVIGTAAAVPAWGDAVDVEGTVTQWMRSA